MDFEITIGLEVHAELSTASKIFCGCSTKFGAEPNTHVCPVCMGLPGVLPVLNRMVVEYAIKTALALNGTIPKRSIFARKNYFYPDLPKNYQISQYEQPFATGGSLDIEVDGRQITVGITRVHLEEDAGKLVHPEDGSASYVDFNRTGVPLLEIVSEPDIHSLEEARQYLLSLVSVLEYLEVCDCKMEEGSLRIDANVSIRPTGSDELGTRTEIKNMNSVKGALKALEFEVERQEKTIISGERVEQVTRHWDESRGVTLPLRSKEEAHDYRYFPEPDLVPLTVDEALVEDVRRRLPELPGYRRQRMVEQYRIPEYDAAVLTASRAMADYFEECAPLHHDAKTVSNWVMVELQRLLNARNMNVQDCKITPKNLADMLTLIDEGTISGKMAKEIFQEMFDTGKPAAAIVEAKGLSQISDENVLDEIISQVVAGNPGPVSDFLGGKERAMGFLVGQVMKSTRGKANPKMVNEVLRKKLDEIKGAGE